MELGILWKTFFVEIPPLRYEYVCKKSASAGKEADSDSVQP
jgi:hypothetical protein